MQNTGAPRSFPPRYPLPRRGATGRERAGRVSMLFPFVPGAGQHVRGLPSSLATINTLTLWVAPLRRVLTPGTKCRLLYKGGHSKYCWKPSRLPSVRPLYTKPRSFCIIVVGCDGRPLLPSGGRFLNIGGKDSHGIPYPHAFHYVPSLRSIKGQAVEILLRGCCRDRIFHRQACPLDIPCETLESLEFVLLLYSML